MPDVVSTVTKRNQVLTPLVGTGATKWYQVLSVDSNPDFTITLSSPVAFTYSHSASGPWQTVPVGAALEVEMRQSELDMYIQVNGTVTVLVG